MAEYILKECRTRDEHDSTIDLFWKVWYDSTITTIMRISRGPFLGEDESPPNIAVTIAANKDRSWKAFNEDPANFRPYWCMSLPGKCGQQRVQLSHWPEDDREGKECAEEIVNQCFYPRANWMNKPMGTMDDNSVHPEHQQKGVGSMLLEYGVRKADELGIECFVEVTDEGMGLYKKFGFMTLTKILVDAENGTTARHEIIQSLRHSP